MIHPGARGLYPLEKDIAYLDHGGFGVTARDIMRVRAEMLDHIEAAPKRFFACEHAEAWTRTAALVAGRFSAGQGKLALVLNASEGVNAVLRSIPFSPGDEIVTTTMIYGAVQIAAEHLAQKQGLKVVQAALRFPDPSPEQCIDALKQALTARTKLVLLDHITSGTGLVMPVREMIALCRDKGVPVCIDGAHAPGQAELNLQDLNPDWYTGNLHKWYGVPRACGFLWAAPGREKDLIPPVLSWTTNDPFPESFSWTGTKDPTPWMCIPAAFDFMDRNFTEQGLREHNHALVMEGAALLAETWGTTIPTPESMTGAMRLVPLPEDLPYALTDMDKLRLQRDLSDAGIVTCIPFFDQRQHYIRIAAYAYNEIGDYKRLAEHVRSLRR